MYAWMQVVSPGSNATDHQYCNDRFSFCISYPDGFRKQLPEPENGDGARFLSKDKRAEISTFGSLATEPFDELQEELKTATEDIQVAYRVVRGNWFIISGFDKDRKVVYRKTVKKKITYFGTKDTEVFQTLEIRYPADQAKEYASYCGQVARSL